MPELKSPLRKRVAYLINEYPKVSHSFIRREILALERLGWEVHRFALRGWDAELPDVDDRAELERTVHVVNKGGLSIAWAVLVMMFAAPGGFWRSLVTALALTRRSDRPFILHAIYLAEACWLARELARLQLSHLHAHFGTNPTDVALLINCLTGISYSFTVHGPEEFDRIVGINLKTKVERAKFVVAISSFGRGQLMRLIHPSGWSKIKVVHCGVDERFLIDSVQANGANKLVCVGRLCEQKGQALLVSAAAQLVGRDASFELVLVGDGENRPIVEQLIRGHQLQGKVRITGWSDGETVRREILDARAFVLPSFAEGLAVVLMEAMALGRPVLTTYIAGNPELVVHEENGWLFPAGSEDELADAMHRCLNAPLSVLQAMGERGARAVAEQHNVQTEAGKLSALFAHALEP
ncbi:glycosyltransferase [Bradyrhizobium sp. LTSP849]|uniref:glycosyltransferase n=1 Tax=Bradyrhizobium sp. LTSP849 TaxID=1615890 RepID=UPI000B172CD6|nr:glycosyltransferase [Bradyrhizobium sp. LTSP849]